MVALAITPHLTKDDGKLISFCLAEVGYSSKGISFHIPRTATSHGSVDLEKCFHDFILL